MLSCAPPYGRVVAAVVDDRSGGTMSEDAAKAGGRRYRSALPAARCLLRQPDTIGQRVERIVAVDDAIPRNDHDSEPRRVRPEWFADGSCRHHLEVLVARERVSVIVTGEHVPHAG